MVDISEKNPVIVGLAETKLSTADNFMLKSTMCRKNTEWRVGGGSVIIMFKAG